MSYEVKFTTNLTEDKVQEIMEVIYLNSGFEKNELPELSHMFTWYGSGVFGVDAYDAQDVENKLIELHNSIN